jgi:hypothetical protein
MVAGVILAAVEIKPPQPLNYRKEIMDKDPDWLITRVFNNDKVELPDIINILTTRGYILARHSKKAIIAAGGQIKGVRRYRTHSMASRKAVQLNYHFNTKGYSSIREDRIHGD